jgi:hypothetical protein
MNGMGKQFQDAKPDAEGSMPFIQGLNDVAKSFVHLA